MQKLLWLTAVTAAFSACAPDGQKSVIIEGVLPLKGPDCTVQSSTTLFQASTLVDLDAPDAVSVMLKVRSTLPSSASTGPGQATSFPSYYGSVESNNLFFETSEVFYSTDAGATPLETVPGEDQEPVVSSVNGSAFPAGGGGVGGTTNAAVNVTIINRESALALDEDAFLDDVSDTDFARIYANIQVVGRTSGGMEIRSTPFRFPVDFCRGCLLTPPEDCPGAETNSVVAPIPNEEVCNQGQDYPSWVCPEIQVVADAAQGTGGG